eukprot:SM000025S08438  [mRNA]  locus=s25:773301:775203:- [translate_table: standard]
MVLYDTPGVMAKQMHMLDEMMMSNVRSAAVNADCVLFLVDVCMHMEHPFVLAERTMYSKNDSIFQASIDMLDEEFLATARRKPVLIVLNKRDLIKPGELAKKLAVRMLAADQPPGEHSGANEVIAISARQGQGMEELKEWVVSKLPLGPALYPKDIVSEHPERFFVAEIVREKIFLQYQQEVPYACQVNVLTYVERKEGVKDFIELDIIVERESQKGILLGKGGLSLKTLATAARLDIEDFVGKPVFLELHVKVQEKWRQDEKLLQDYGYDRR